MSRKLETNSTSYRIQDFDDDIHIMPNDDWFKHDASINCACNPYHDIKNALDIKQGYASKYVFVHRKIKGHKAQLI